MLALILTLAKALLFASEMAHIPAGEFQMGRSKTTKDDSTGMRPQVLLDDRPVHKVSLPAFSIDTREVTNGRYSAFVRATRRQPPRHWVAGQIPAGAAELPVYNVDWHDAAAFCQWDGKRLPTEAEFERVARSGKEGLSYPWGDKWEPKNARFNSQNGPSPAGQFPPNDFGVFDIVGNVAEWTADWYDHDYYQTSPSDNPKGPEKGEYRIIRGGAWSDPPARLTVFFRNWVRPNQKTPNIGFRCAK